jgi:hypothetical protein
MSDIQKTISEFAHEESKATDTSDAAGETEPTESYVNEYSQYSLVTPDKKILNQRILISHIPSLKGGRRRVKTVIIYQKIQHQTTNQALTTKMVIQWALILRFILSVISSSRLSSLYTTIPS